MTTNYNVIKSDINETVDMRRGLEFPALVTDHISRNGCLLHTIHIKKEKTKTKKL